MNISLPLYSFLPITISLINLIIGFIFIYFFFINTHKKLVFMGLFIISLSLFSILAGSVYLFKNFFTAIWLFRIYYFFLVFSALFFILFIYNNIDFKTKWVYKFFIYSLLLFLILIFTKYFIPYSECAKDYLGRFAFKKGILYPFFIAIFYSGYIYTLIIVSYKRKEVKEIDSININYILIGVIILLCVGINDFAGILGVYKTIPLISYSFIIFSIILIEPFFKRYIIFFKDLNKNYKDTIKVFAKMLEIKDPLVYGNARRVGVYAKYIGRIMNLSKDKCENLELSALLYNIGQIGIPDKLLKSKNVTSEESALLEKKIEDGKRIVSRMVLLYNFKELINFPEFYKIGRRYRLLIQIMSIADYINKSTLSSYLDNKFDFEKILSEIKKNEFINSVLINTIISNSNKIENLILENLLLLKGL